MTDANQETISDIVAEMRLGKTGDMPFAYLIGMPDSIEVFPGGATMRRINIKKVELGELADRIEAAHKRECHGNAAAMREALVKLREIANVAFEKKLEGVETVNLPQAIWYWCGKALSEPVRNCDRFVDETDAQIAFLNEVWLISVTKETALERDRFENWTDEMRSRYAKWLLAPAAERKGGRDVR